MEEVDIMRWGSAAMWAGNTPEDAHLGSAVARALCRKEGLIPLERAAGLGEGA